MHSLAGFIDENLLFGSIPNLLLYKSEKPESLPFASKAKDWKKIQEKKLFIRINSPSSFKLNKKYNFKIVVKIPKSLLIEIIK